MSLVRTRKLALLCSFATLAAVGAGGCLPQNFYADLAGNAFSSAVLSVLEAFVQQLLGVQA